MEFLGCDLVSALSQNVIRFVCPSGPSKVDLMKGGTLELVQGVGETRSRRRRNFTLIQSELSSDPTNLFYYQHFSVTYIWLFSSIFIKTTIKRETSFLSGSFLIGQPMDEYHLHRRLSQSPSLILSRESSFLRTDRLDPLTVSSEVLCTRRTQESTSHGKSNRR